MGQLNTLVLYTLREVSELRCAMGRHRSDVRTEGWRTRAPQGLRDRRPARRVDKQPNYETRENEYPGTNFDAFSEAGSGRDVTLSQIREKRF